MLSRATESGEPVHANGLVWCLHCGVAEQNKVKRELIPLATEGSGGRGGNVLPFPAPATLTRALMQAHKASRHSPSQDCNNVQYPELSRTQILMLKRNQHMFKIDVLN